MKLNPIHTFGGLVALIVVLCVIILVIKSKSTYDAGGPAAGGQSATDMGSIIVYGSKTCPWCVKQESYLTAKGISYTFVDCKTETCPDFVQGYPTIMTNNQITSGYSEMAGPLTN
jgi:glutaredoxin